MPANTNLARVFEQLGMPGMAARARAGKDLSRAVLVMSIPTSSWTDRLHGESTIIISAAKLDGYDPELLRDQHNADMAALSIKMSY